MRVAPRAGRRGPALSRVYFCAACGAPAERFIQPEPHSCFWLTSCSHASVVKRVSLADLERIRRRYAEKIGADAREWIASCDGAERC